MIDTILFDLDGTLLISDSDKFTAAYFAALGKYMSRLHDPDELVKAVWAGTKAMVKNHQQSGNTVKDCRILRRNLRVKLPIAVLTGIRDRFCSLHRSCPLTFPWRRRRRRE